jgi:hypothetical protein
MGYYIRVLGISDPDIPIDYLAAALESDGLTAKFRLDENEALERWSVLDVADMNGEMLFRIERNPVIEGTLGKEELDEFREEISECKPHSAAKWLAKYFDLIQVIYAFQLLDASMRDESFPIVSSVKAAIWKKIGGILQADNEGFSNEDGYHILWQFDDDVAGEWNMAVKTILGNWTTFSMDLGNPEHRKAFKSGKVPTTASRV